VSGQARYRLRCQSSPRGFLMRAKPKEILKNAAMKEDANGGGRNAYIDGAVVDPDLRRTKYRNSQPANHTQIASKTRLSACNHQSGISSP
jgi:hypothetical protein